MVHERELSTHSPTLQRSAVRGVRVRALARPATACVPTTLIAFVLRRQLRNLRHILASLEIAMS